MKPKIAILSFPGNNCEVESIRSVKNSGMEPVFFRWNDDRARLKDIDGYFIPGGFSHEDRGRAGMVSARDPLLAFLHEEAERGKVIIGNCNGAQVLVESGLIPLGDQLQMSLARNAIDASAVGFLGEWVWITPTCAKDKCVTSNWDGVMHVPIAHGEGRFTTKDKDLIAELKKNDQIAFSYCTEDGKVSKNPLVTPNGSEYAIAGICNPAGNVVALMPHPERTPNGDAYFESMRMWIESGVKNTSDTRYQIPDTKYKISDRSPKGTEIFIDTLITNNEERTVEQAAHRIAPGLKLKQLKYVSLSADDTSAVLGNIAMFNANKEVAYIRRGEKLTKWNADSKTEEDTESPLGGIALLRRDEPDTGASALGQGSETGVCYVCSGIGEEEVANSALQQVFANPHASTLEKLV